MAFVGGFDCKICRETDLFHIFTASPLADNTAVLSELKHTVLTSDL